MDGTDLNYEEIVEVASRSRHHPLGYGKWEPVGKYCLHMSLAGT